MGSVPFIRHQREMRQALGIGLRSILGGGGGGIVAGGVNQPTESPGASHKGGACQSLARRPVARAVPLKSGPFGISERNFWVFSDMSGSDVSHRS